MLGLLFLPLVARAQALPAYGFPYAQTSVNTYAFSGGITTAANAANIAFGNPANGAIYAQSTQSLPLGGGYSATIQARAIPAKPDVAKAVGTFARGVGGAALKTAGAVYAAAEVAKALNDLCNDLGYSCYKGGDGSPVVDKRGETTYSWTVYAGGPVKVVRSATAGGACVAAGGTWSGATCLPWYSQPAQTGNPVTGASTPSSIEELEASIAAASGWPSTSTLPRVLEQAVASGAPVPLPAPSTITGPLTVPGVPTVTNFPDGSKTTVTPEKSISYGPGAVTVTDRVVTTQTSPGGVTSITGDTTAPAPLPPPAPVPAPAPEVATCGLPGKPACKIDEAGTPSPVPGTQYDAVLDPFKQSVDDKRAVIGGTGDKSFFGGWSLFFFAPPVVQCEPLAMPT